MYRIKLVPLTNGHSSGQGIENESVRGQKSSKEGQKVVKGKNKKGVSKGDPNVSESDLNVSESDLNVPKSGPSVASEDRLPPNNNHHSYTGMSQDVGLQFIDHSLEADRFITKEELARLDTEKMTWVHPSHYPLASINQVCKNPRFLYFSGLVSD